VTTYLAFPFCSTDREIMMIAMFTMLIPLAFFHPPYTVPLLNLPAKYVILVGKALA